MRCAGNIAAPSPKSHQLILERSLPNAPIDDFLLCCVLDALVKNSLHQEIFFLRRNAFEVAKNVEVLVDEPLYGAVGRGVLLYADQRGNSFHSSLDSHTHRTNFAEPLTQQSPI